jgi:hypothetical protein
VALTTLHMTFRRNTKASVELLVGKTDNETDYGYEKNLNDTITRALEKGPSHGNSTFSI